MSTTNGISNLRTASSSAASSSGSVASSQQKISSLFNQIDSSGSGHITKAQFEQAFNKLNLPSNVKGIGPEAAYSKLDPSGTGVVTKKDFIAGMETLMKPKSGLPAKVRDDSKAASVTKAGDSNGMIQGMAVKAAVQPASGPIGSKINVTA